jgi:hypothetical protein
MVLPGGLNQAGELHRDFRFRPVNGELELIVRDSGEGAESLADQVTRVLSLALESIGGVTPTVDLVRELSVGDRQYLMTRLALHIDTKPVWLVAHCTACGEPFDISLDFADLPIKPAGECYPQTTVNTSLGRLRVRSPNGADQEHMALAQDDDQAMQVMLKRIVTSDGAQVDTKALNEADLKAIEETVEALSPECASRLFTQCPQCDAPNGIPVNLYALLEQSVDGLFEEIHLLASHYHWSEQAILALPRRRRQTYLRLIDKRRGMLGPEDITLFN